MTNVSDKSCTESRNTYFVCVCVCVCVCVFLIRAVYEIMWKNIVERGRPQMRV